MRNQKSIEFLQIIAEGGYGIMKYSAMSCLDKEDDVGFFVYIRGQLKTAPKGVLKLFGAELSAKLIEHLRELEKDGTLSIKSEKVINLGEAVMLKGEFCTVVERDGLVGLQIQDTTKKKLLQLFFVPDWSQVVSMSGNNVEKNPKVVKVKHYDEDDFSR
jgi:hypothetical protein